MDVTECIDVDHIDVCGGEEDILDKRREHMPRLEEDDGSVKPETVGSQHGQNDRPEDRICEGISAVPSCQYLCLDLQKAVHTPRTCRRLLQLQLSHSGYLSQR